MESVKAVSLNSLYIARWWTLHLSWNPPGKPWHLCSCCVADIQFHNTNPLITWNLTRWSLASSRDIATIQLLCKFNESTGILWLALALCATVFVSPLMPTVHPTSLWLGGMCWVGRMQTAITQARESASSSTPLAPLLDRDNTVFSGSDSPHQSPNRSVTDYSVFGRNEREEGKHKKGQFNRLQNETIGVWVEEEREIPKGTVMWCITLPIVMASWKLEWWCMVTSLKVSEWLPFFFPNGTHTQKITIACFFRSHML